MAILCDAGMAAMEPSSVLPPDADAHRATRNKRGRLMYEHSCAKAGAVGCGWVIRANSEEDLKSRVIEHARKKHNVQGMTDTIYTYLRAKAQKA
jgi:predicted small metal-binding protein